MKVVNFASRKFLAVVVVSCLLVTIALLYIQLKHVTRPSSQHHFSSPSVLKNQQEQQVKASHSSARQQPQQQPQSVGSNMSFHVHPEVKRISQPAYLNVIDPKSMFVANSTAHQDITSKCRFTKTTPGFWVCLHPTKLDVYISASLNARGVWEPEFTNPFQRVLRHYPQATVLDAGANIGYFSLLSAAMGHRVVAIEPVTANMMRFARGVQLNGFMDKITVLNNALAESHKNVTMDSSIDNQGGIPVQKNSRGTGNVQTILMDDLLHVIQTHDVIVKMDIESYECRALAASKRLFSDVNIPYFFMEWFMLLNNRNRASTFCPTAAIKEMADTFVHLGYQPYDVGSGRALDPQKCIQWRETNVYWKHRDQPQVAHPHQH